MSLISRMRKQDAVYWPPGSVDQFGKTVPGTAVAIKCRWEDKQEKYIGSDGNEKVSRAVIYPDRVLALRGYVWLGLLAGAPTDPRLDPDACEVASSGQIPNLRNTETLYVVMV